MFGSYNGMLGQASTSAIGLQNGYNSPYQQAHRAQQQYNNMINSSLPVKVDWVFNGRICTVREMANMIWPTDCPDKTHFILKYE